MLRSLLSVLLMLVVTNLINCVDFNSDVPDFKSYLICKPQYIFGEGIKSNVIAKPSEKLESEIQQLAGESDKFGKLSEYIGQKGGEAVSWISAMVFVAKGISDMVAIASPAVGLVSWVFGLIVMYKDKQEKKEFIRNLQESLSSISNQMDVRLMNMQEYFDANTVEFESSVLGGEFKQMYSYMSDCMRTDHQPSRRRCLIDRCSYVRAGFHKFAIHHDKLSDEYEKDPRSSELPQTTNEKVVSMKIITRKWNYKSPEDEKFKKWNAKYKKLYEKFSPLQVRRVQANMQMFSLYVESLLLPCEFVRLFDKTITLSGGDDDTLEKWRQDLIKDEYQEMVKEETDDFNMKDMVYNYMKNANQVILQAYQDFGKHNVHSVQHGGIKQGKNEIQVKCRIRMNPINFDTCDVLVRVPYKYYEEKIKPKYLDNIDGMLRDFCNVHLLPDDKTLWDQTQQAETYKNYFEQVQELMAESDVWGNKAEEFKLKFNKLYETVKKTYNYGESTNL